MGDDSATLLAALAHEINNPISYVLGNLAELAKTAQAIRAALGCSEKIEGLELIDELIEDATLGAERIRDLVRDLLALQQSDSVRDALDVGEALEQTLRLVAARLAFRATLARDHRATRRVLASPTGLGQVLLNLIGNAIDACPPGDAANQRIAVRTRDVPDGVRIEIEDSGPGISKDMRERLFEPFATSKPTGRGTGLGLYICRRIVHEHGGTIGYQCPVSGGTIFSIELPAALDGEA